jgi:hypothetical protein
MFVDPKSRIAGVPALKVRDFLRQASDHFWRSTHAATRLEVSTTRMKALIAELARLGYIERVEVSGAGDWYKVTLNGAAFGLASAARPLFRRTAERRLGELLDRTREVNRNQYYLYRVRKLIVFGSLLSEMDRLNDIDVAVDLAHKIADITLRDEANRRRISVAKRKGRRFSNLVDELFWPLSFPKIPSN